MKKLLYTGLLISLSLVAFCQNSLMYEISGNNLKQKSYLFGTIHMQKESLFRWNQRVYDAIDSCDVAAFELNLQSPDAIRKAITEEMMAEWKTFFMDDFAPALESAIPPDSLAAKLIRFIKPLTGLIANLRNDTNNRQDFVDAYLQNYAVKQGKSIMGIETVSEQVNVINSIDKTALKNGLLSYLKSDDWNSGLMAWITAESKMVKDYENQDFDALCTYLINAMNTEKDKAFSEFYRRLFEVRNEIMFERTKEVIKTKPMFIAVGTGHLCGPTGLVESFKKAGYTVTPVDIKTPGQRKQIVWGNYQTSYFSVDVPYGVDSIYDEDADSWNPSSSEMINTTYTPKGKASFSIYQYYGDNLEVAEMADEDIDAEYHDMDSSELSSENLEYDDDQEEEEVTEVLETQPPLEMAGDSIKKKSYLKQVSLSLVQQRFDTLIKFGKLLLTEPLSTDTIFLGTGDNQRMIIKTRHASYTELKLNIPEIWKDKVLVSEGWTLEVTGDPAIMKGDEVYRFFTSFKVKEGK